MVNILAMAGSTRDSSYNKAVIKIAAQAASELSAKVTLVDFDEYPLPIFDADLENDKGLPENAKKLKELFIAADGFLIASPEYNSGMSGVLKNVIDWVSRQEHDDEPRLAAYTGKVAAIMSASPSPLGGLRGLRHLREILTNIGVLVIPEQKTLHHAHEKINEEGKLLNASDIAAYEKLGKRLVEVTMKLKT